MPVSPSAAALKRRRLLTATAIAITATSLPAATHAQASGAQTDAPITPIPLQSTAATGAIAVQGTVTDPDLALVPGATITLAPAKGKSYVVTSGSDGTYALRGVPAGSYAFTITMPGFASYVRQGVRIAGGTTTINVKLAIQDANTVVNVTADENLVSVDADSNASSTVLKGKDLDALSDDPDELASELSALAGPAAGPNGGQIYIDGFTGGQLPPKSSIREIRINQNPFSAQYDRPGFGRVEVFTKPGTDKLHGSLQLNGADKSFNTGSPFVPASVFQPDYHTFFTFGSITGPINKRASYSMNGSYRDIQDNSVVRPASIYSTSPTSTVPCAPGQAGCTTYTNNGNGGGLTFVQFAPQKRWDVSPRLDLALGEKNTLTVRFQYEHNSAQNQNIGGNDLPSTGFNSTSHETTIQVSDTQIINAKVINETRFEFQREPSNQTPFSSAPTVNVQGGFTSGGYSGQTVNNVPTHIEFQNYTSVALSKHFLRIGGRLRTTSQNSTTTANSNGTITYSSINNYIAGTPTSYQITRINTPTISARNLDVGLYAEDDWKVRPNLTLSYGLRFETQNFINDHADLAPRAAIAYALGKKTVLRAGAGFFYDRFSLGNQLSIRRNNGTNQQIFTVSAPSGSTLTAACSPTNIAVCNTLATTSGRLTVRNYASGLGAPFTNLTSPYQIQENLGIDQQLFKGATISLNYQHIRGVHQFQSDVPNYATATGSAANPLLYQYQSNGVFTQNQLVTNVNYRGKYGSIGSYYILNFAKSDTSGSGGFASVPNRLAADYGRASFDTRNRFFMFGSFTLPYLISVSPFIVAQSGAPYNITSGLDVYSDNIYNTRAYLVGPSAVVPAGASKSINGCGTFVQSPTLGTAPIAGTSLAPVNYCTGPANFTFNLRVAKTFGFGEKRGSSQGGDQGGPGGGDHDHGGPPGSSRGGSSRGSSRGGSFGGGGGASSGKRFNMTLGAQAQNLFNIADRSAPTGTFTSPSFGVSSQLAGSIYTTDSAVRRISLQLSMSF